MNELYTYHIYKTIEDSKGEIRYICKRLTGSFIKKQIKKIQNYLIFMKYVFLMCFIRYNFKHMYL